MTYNEKRKQWYTHASHLDARIIINVVLYCPAIIWRNGAFLEMRATAIFYPPTCLCIGYLRSEFTEDSSIFKEFLLWQRFWQHHGLLYDFFSEISNKAYVGINMQAA